MWYQQSIQAMPLFLFIYLFSKSCPLQKEPGETVQWPDLLYYTGKTSCVRAGRRAPCALLVGNDTISIASFHQHSPLKTTAVVAKVKTSPAGFQQLQYWSLLGTWVEIELPRHITDEEHRKERRKKQGESNTKPFPTIHCGHWRWGACSRLCRTGLWLKDTIQLLRALAIHHIQHRWGIW